MEEFKRAFARLSDRQKLTARDVAALIGNDEQTLLKFIVDNDFEQAYRILHDSPSDMIVGENASFIPDKKKTEGEIHLLLLKKDYDTLNYLLQNFKVNRNSKHITSAPAILESLQDMQILQSFPDGTLRFKILLKN